VATTQTLIGEVRDRIRDYSSSTRDEKILEKLNEGLSAVAGQILLPDLITSGEVTAEGSRAYVNLPDNYHREVLLVTSASALGRVKLNMSWQRFLTLYPTLDNQGGNICEVVVRGRQLFYQPLPSVRDTLTIHYYRKPTPLTLEDKTAEPEAIPEHLHMRLLASYAAREFFDKIEDGIEGPKINYTNQNRAFATALLDLIDFLPPQDGLPQEIEDDADYIQ